MIKFNELNKGLFQIIGDINGININGMMWRNKNGAENVNHYDYEYKYFKGKILYKVRGVCKHQKHFLEKLKRELEA